MWHLPSAVRPYPEAIAFQLTKSLLSSLPLGRAMGWITSGRIVQLLLCEMNITPKLVHYTANKHLVAVITNIKFQKILTGESNRANAEDSNVVGSGGWGPVGVHDNISGGDAVTAGEEEVGAKHNGERVSGDRTVPVAVSSGHDAVVGDDGTTAHGLEDDQNLDHETSLHKTYKQR